MLLMNKSGLIYDVPEQIAEKYVATQWNSSKEVISDMLSTLHKPASAEVAAECGCCCQYANYCPNK